MTMSKDIQERNVMYMEQTTITITKMFTVQIINFNIKKTNKKTTTVLINMKM